TDPGCIVIEAAGADRRKNAVHRSAAMPAGYRLAVNGLDVFLLEVTLVADIVVDGHLSSPLPPRVPDGPAVSPCLFPSSSAGRGTLPLLAWASLRAVFSGR